MQPSANGLIVVDDRSTDGSLDIVRGYVAIERVRFGDRLDVAIDADARALETPIPAMILQPLVENAVRHAVAVRDEPTSITVRATVVGDALGMQRGARTGADLLLMAVRPGYRRLGLAQLLMYAGWAASLAT